MKRCEQIGMEEKYTVQGEIQVFDGKTLVGCGASRTDAKKIANALNLQHRVHRGCMGCANQGDLCFRCSRRPQYQDFYTRKR
jgi:hypothetical protein